MILALKQRSQATLNVYLLLKRGSQLLLSLRENTGYLDGYYYLVAGHVEENESATSALIREAQEEIGITINPLDVHLKGIVHRKTDRNNVDFFFECSKWEGEIQNKEPHKCGEIKFFDLDDLPPNTAPQIQKFLNKDYSHTLYLEEGW